MIFVTNNIFFVFILLFGYCNGTKSRPADGVVIATFDDDLLIITPLTFMKAPINRGSHVADVVVRDGGSKHQKALASRKSSDKKPSEMIGKKDIRLLEVVGEKDKYLGKCKTQFY